MSKPVVQTLESYAPQLTSNEPWISDKVKEQLRIKAQKRLDAGTREYVWYTPTVGYVILRREFGWFEKEEYKCPCCGVTSIRSNK